MSSQELLVIILTIALAVFLILAIVVAIQLIRILHHIDHISERAEDVADNIANVSDQVKRGFKPMAAVGMVADVVAKFMGNKSNKKRKGGK